MGKGERLDFLNPFMTAAIITNPADPNTRYPLWTFTDPNGKLKGTVTSIDRSSPASVLSSLAFLSELTVKLNLSFCPTITAVLTPPFEQARAFIESPLVEWTQSTIEVQYGYAGVNGALSPKFEALILKPEVSLGVDASITLNAQGVGGFEAQRGTSGDPKKNTSLSAVFRELCDKHGMELDAKELTGDALALWNEKRESIVPGYRSDWWFMVEEATHIGCWIYHTMSRTNGRPTLKVIAVDEAQGAAPTYTFRMFDFPGGKLDAASGDLPILSITTPTSAVYLAGATQKLRMMGIDSKTREVKEVTTDDQQSAIQRTDNKQTGLKTSKPPDGGFLPADGGSSNAQQMADSAFRSAANNMGVKIEVQTVGIPNLVPGQVVEVAGVAKTRIDGKYAVFEVTHTLGTGGFTTSFTAFSNVGQLSSRLNRAKPATNPNTQASNSKSPDATTARTNTVSVKPKTDLAVDASFLDRIVLR